MGVRQRHGLHCQDKERRFGDDHDRSHDLKDGSVAVQACLELPFSHRQQRCQKHENGVADHQDLCRRIKIGDILGDAVLQGEDCHRRHKKQDTAPR